MTAWDVLWQEPTDQWRQHCQGPSRPTRTSDLPWTDPHTLPPATRLLYEELTSDPDSLEQLLDDWARCPFSSRLFNLVVVQFPLMADDTYGIDARDQYVSRRQPFGPQVRLCRVGAAYQQQLARYGKAALDPFARGARVAYQRRNGITVGLSLRQLNFFRWAQREHILEFMLDHGDGLRQCQQQCNASVFSVRHAFSVRQGQA